MATVTPPRLIPFLVLLASLGLLAFATVTILLALQAPAAAGSVTLTATPSPLPQLRKSPAVSQGTPAGASVRTDPFN
jgi:hypothetical protein